MRGAHRAIALIVAGAAAVSARSARGDGLSLAAEPIYTLSRTRVTDAAGITTTTDTQSLGQQYRLGLDKSFSEVLRWRASGTFLRDDSWSEIGQTSQDAARQDWTLSTGLGWGGQLLGGSFSYDRDTVDSRLELRAPGTAPARTRSPTLVSENYGAFVGWHPAELPSLDLRLTRADQRDEFRTTLDTSTTTAGLRLAFAPVSEVGLTYATTYTSTDDRVSDSSTWSLGQNANATYRRTLFRDRSNVYLAYGLQSMISDTRATSPLGTVQTQRFPLAGLSLVESFPETPQADTLKPNPALIDGNVTSGAGLDLGFQRTLAGDAAYRDMGVQMPATLDAVNVVHVWVDRRLPEAVWRAVEWTAYRSDDNIDWTPVPLGGPIVFAPFQNRFEIPIQRTQSKFLKLVTRPLAPTVTTDAALGAILVTEVQVFDVASAESVAGRRTTTTNAVSGTVTTKLLDAPALTHDLSFQWGTTGGQPAVWMVANGLGLTQSLHPAVTLHARAARTDSGAAGRHTGQFDWAASLGVKPIPAASGGASYSGTWSQGPGGDQLRNSTSVFARADLYQGVSVTGNAGQAFGSGQGTSSRSTFASATTSIVPNRVVSLSGSYAYNRAHTEQGGVVRESEGQQATGLVNLTPFPALLATAGATRSTQTGTPARLLWNFLVSYTPLRGGDLVLTLQHSETSDNVTDSTTRLTGGSLRWNIRSNTSMDLSYSSLDDRAPQGRTRSDTLQLHLLVTFL